MCTFGSNMINQHTHFTKYQENKWYILITREKVNQIQTSSLSWPVLSNMVATSHIWLFKFKFIKAKLKFQFSHHTSLFQVRKSYMQLMATKLDNANIDHSHHCRKCSALIDNTDPNEKVKKRTKTTRKYQRNCQVARMRYR